MKKVNFLLILTLLLFVFSSKLQAQEIESKWSETIKQSKGGDGFFKYFLEANDEYIYAAFSKEIINKRNPSLKIVAFDKNTLKRRKEVEVIGYKDKSRKEKYKGLSLELTIVNNDVLTLFWKKYEKGNTYIYVEQYNKDLKQIKKVKKIHQYPGRASATILSANVNGVEMYFFANQNSPKKGENYEFEYKVINAEFEFVAANKVKLPITAISKFNSSLRLNFKENGKILVSTSVRDEEEKKFYPIVCSVDIETAETKLLELKFPDKKLAGFDYILTNGKYKVFSFFTDLIKDPKGRDTHGIFYAEVDGENLTFDNSKFSSFSKEQLDELFGADREDRAKAGVLASKKKKDSKDNALAAGYNIEFVYSLGEEIVLFTSLMRNYSVTTCDSKGNCTTRYYCEKSNVTSFKLNNYGNIVWASNLDRKMTYPGWDVTDVRVLYKDGLFYASYGSGYNEGAKGKKKKKSKSQRKMNFEYAVFSIENGNYTKMEHQLNKKSTPKKELKFIDPSNISFIDDEFYVASNRLKLSPIFWIKLVVFMPSLWFTFRNSHNYKGTVSVGKISAVD
jgi:hypothetical protein